MDTLNSRIKIQEDVEGEKIMTCPKMLFMNMLPRDMQEMLPKMIVDEDNTEIELTEGEKYRTKIKEIKHELYKYELNKISK